MNTITFQAEATHQHAAVAAKAEQAGAGKWFPIGLSLVLLVAVLLPIKENLKANPKDNFPLSHFPMFSEVRGETYKVAHLVGLDAEANRHMVRHTFAGTGGLNQVRRQIRKTVREGGAATLCESVAARVAKSKQKSLAAVSQIQIVTGEYNLNEYFAGNKTPVKETTHATCNVERSKQ
ncbi:MAG: hypothetical protein SF097_08915 [Acidobacteriota bacterium]|nr:hypothetical protein [Acidobacteriota bacterium]